MEQNKFLSKLWSFQGHTNQQSINFSGKTPYFKPGLLTNNTLTSMSNSSSSFYDGKVQYGGAMSALQNNLSSPYVVPKIKKIANRTKSVSKTNKSTLTELGGSLSSTARKILQTLEKMSAPLRDIKKIPPPTLNASHLFAGHSKKRPLGYQSFDNNKKFCPPSSGRVALSHTGENFTAKLPLDNSLSTHSLIKNLPSSEKSVTTTSVIHKGKPAVLASLSSSSGFKSATSGGKIRVQRRNHSHYSSTATVNDLKEDDIVQSNLPEVTFTINKLPSFNFNHSDNTSTPAPPKPIKKSETDDFALDSLYTFAIPKHSSKTKKKVFQKSNNFTKNTQNLVQTTSSEKNASNSNIDTFIPVKELKTSASVMDILNNSDNVNEVCVTNQIKSSISETFNKASGQWKSDACLIDNGKDNTQCVVIEIPKPNCKKNSLPSSNSPMPEIQLTENKIFANDKQTFSTESTEVSFVAETNIEKKLINKVISNNESKPALSEMFKKTVNQWTCAVCLIDNDGDRSSCLACESSKPDSEEKKSIPSKSNNKPIFSSNIHTFGGTSSKGLFGAATSVEKKLINEVVSDGKSKPSLNDLFKKSENKLKHEVGLIDKDRINYAECESSIFKSVKDASEKTDKTPSTLKNIFSKPNVDLTKKDHVPKFSFGVKEQNSDEPSSNFRSVSNDCETGMFVSCKSSKSETTTNNDSSKKVSTFKFGPTSSSVLQFGLDKSKTEPNSTNANTGILSKSTDSFTRNSAPSVTFSNKENACNNSPKVADKTKNMSLKGSNTSTFKFGSSVSTFSADQEKTEVSSPSNSKSDFQLKTNSEFSENNSSTSFFKCSQNSKSTSQNIVSSNITNSTSLVAISVLSFGDGQKSTNSSENSVQSPQLPVSQTNNQIIFGNALTSAEKFPKLQTTTFNSFNKQSGIFSKSHPVITTVSATSSGTIPSLPKPMFTFGTNSNTSESPISKTNEAPNSFLVNSTQQNPSFGNFQVSKNDVKPLPSGFSGFTKSINSTQSDKSDTLTFKPPFTLFGNQTNVSLGQKTESLPAEAPAFSGFSPSTSISFSSTVTVPNASRQVASSLPNASFAFGNSKTTQSHFQSNVFSNPSVSNQINQPPSFQFGSNATSASQSNTMFGTSSSNNNQKPAFSFGSAENTSSQTPLGIPQFGPSPTVSSNSSGFNFSGATQNPTPSAGFNFGSSLTNKPMFSVNPNPSNPSFQFGSNQNLGNVPSGSSSNNNNFQFPAQNITFGQGMGTNPSTSLFNIGQSGRATPNRTMKQAKRRLRK